MKQEEWTKQLHDRLADYEAPVPHPDNLWAKIEARLPKEFVAPKKKVPPHSSNDSSFHFPHSTFHIPRSSWAVAAVFTGAIVGTVLLWHSDQEAKTAVVALTETAPASMESERSDYFEKSEYPEESEHTETTQKKMRAITLIARDTSMESGEIGMKDCSPTSSLNEDRVREPSPIPAEKIPEKIIRELDQKIVEHKLLRRRHIALSLYASNGFGNMTSRNGVLMSPQMLANYDYYTNDVANRTRSGEVVYLANHEERQKYYQPISIGLSANLPISSNLSLSSGVVYTRLHSDITSIANWFVYDRKQTFHYVGIPLTVQYCVWQWYRLHVYASAGGQADINVKARQNADGVETDLEKDRVQWSVNASMGVQYNFIPQLGIYAEPGIKHYFDNGSQIRNYFKHHPTNFNLQVGLRLNLNN